MAMVGAAVVVALALGGYWYWTTAKRMSVAFSWTLSSGNPPVSSSVKVSGTYFDRMNEGDSQLVDFVVESDNVPADDSRSILLRIVGPGLAVEPAEGYLVPVAMSGERKLRFSVAAIGSGQKAGLVYSKIATAFDEIGSVTDSGPWATTNLESMLVTVAPDTTFGLRQASWTVINIVALLAITIVAGLSTFLFKALGWLWRTGWTVHENWDRIDRFLKSPPSDS